MKFIKLTIMAAAVTSVQFCASAQDNKEKELQKAIVVEKDFVPVETKATKTDVLPEEMPLTTHNADLKFSDWAVPAQVVPMLEHQSPIRYPDANLMAFRKRGYAMFGGGNYFNIVGSAGYRILAGDRTKLGAWFQHNSTNGDVMDYNGIHFYNKFMTDDKDGKYYPKQFITDDKLGIDFSNKFNNGTLSAGMRYHYEKFNYLNKIIPESTQTVSIIGKRKQNVNDANIHLLWENDNESLRYYVGGMFNYMGFRYGSDIGMTELPKGLKEYHAGLDFGLRAEFGEKSFIGADAGLQTLNYDYPFKWIEKGEYYRIMKPGLVSAYSFGMFSIKPFYSKQTDKINLRIGADIDISFNRGTVFRIAPDVKFDAALSDMFSVFVSATGGNKINTFHETQARNRYINPSLELPVTYTLVDAVAGFNLGKWKGLSVSPYVGFAVKKDNIIPVAIGHPSYPLYQTIYNGIDMNGFIAGIKFGYKFRDLFDISANYAFTPQDYDSGYTLSDDSPEHSFDATVKITPIKRLNVELGYQLRALRKYRLKGYIYDFISEEPITYENNGIDRMRNLSNLNLGASYQFNDMVGLFVQANNLLNREYEIYYGGMYGLVGIQAQKLNILGGITLNF